MKLNVLIIVLLSSINRALAQKQFSFSSNNSMYPLKVINSKYPSNDTRFNDNSCLIYVPKHFNKNKPWHFFFWFHGSTNNIQSTIEQFKLREQLNLSKINAIIVMPEAAKNAPESYAGNWEQPNNFNYFMEDLQLKLKSEKIVDSITNNNQLIIAGHSGAARVIVKVLDFSKTAIRSILLFDAIYGNEQNIINALKRFPNCKLFNLYSNRESCLRSSKRLMEMLAKDNMSFVNKQDIDVTDIELKLNKIFCLSSMLSHNDIPVSNNYLSRFLKASE